MSEKSLADAIKHYQKDIERCPDNTERMLRCIKRLYVMPIKMVHLQATGVGRSVNNLRESGGEVGDAATALVAKWKAMVAAEDGEPECDAEAGSAPEEEERLNGSAVEDTVRDKENIRQNHTTTTTASSAQDRSRSMDKSKHKEDKSNKHSSSAEERQRKGERKEEKHSSKTEQQSDDKNRHKSSDRNHKSEPDKSSKYKDDKHRSKEKSSTVEEKKSSKDDKHTNRDKSERHSGSKTDRHSSKSRSEKEATKEVSSSKEKERKEEKNKRSQSGSDLCKESSSSQGHKSDKRKHHSTSHHHHSSDTSKKLKLIKQEKISSDEESDVPSQSDRQSDTDDSESSDSEDAASDSHSQEDSDNSESYSRLKIKQEPHSDSSAGSDSPPRRMSKSHRDRHLSSNSGPHSTSVTTDMKPPSTSSSSNLKALIRENEKKIKKEKTDNNDKSKKAKVKIEMNQDGSIDSGSGASFADALLGFDQPVKPTSGGSGGSKKQPKKSQRGESSKTSVSSSQASRSRSPSQCSTSSSLSTSPSKSDRKPDFSREAPEMLLKRPKLEPLNLDISSTLPEISTNYKPLPNIQSRHMPQALTEEDMFTIMTSKNQRTKVYSGLKYGHMASVPSLYSICIQILFDNIEGLEYTGGVPYDILKPLLIKLNSEQLLSLEHYNPYLVSDTDQLWKFHSNKRFPRAVRDDLETWRETYLRCTDEREVKLKKLTANITESMAKSTPVRQAKLAYVDTVAKPPRSVARKQAKYGTASSSSSTVSSATSSGNFPANLEAAAANQAKKKEIMSKAVVGGFTPSTPATDHVSAPFNNPATAAKILKKKKAPLMAKALQLIKSNHRYKR